LLENIISLWIPGGGGDFIMSALTHSMNGKHPLHVNDKGTAWWGGGDWEIRFGTKKQILNNRIGNYNFYRLHDMEMHKTDKSLKKNYSFIMFTYPTGKDLVKKQIMKLEDMFLKFTSKRLQSALVVGNPMKKFRNEIQQAIKNKDYKTAFYFSYCHQLQLYKNWLKRNSEILENYSHVKISTHMNTYEGIVNVLKELSHILDFDLSIDDVLKSAIDDYVSKQQVYLEDWPYLRY